jgi:hypothetical protein
VAAGVVVGIVLASGDRPEAPPPATEAPPSAPAEPSPREKILARFASPDERRLAGELLDRNDKFLTALQEKDSEAAQELFDGRTFGQNSKEVMGEILSRAVLGKRLGDTELESWEIEDVELRARGEGRPAGAATVVTFKVRHAKANAETVLSHRRIFWIRRPDGWYVTVPPRPADK